MVINDNPAKPISQFNFELNIKTFFSPYDICETITNMADSLCPSFPETQPCGCPLLAGDLDLKNVELAVPDFGPILGPLMAVSIIRQDRRLKFQR
jgi:hypothetical protein